MLYSVACGSPYGNHGKGRGVCVWCTKLLGYFPGECLWMVGPASLSTAKGIIEAGARKLRPGWCKGPVGTEGGKPRPDYELPNLTPRTLNVVNVLGRVF